MILQNMLYMFVIHAQVVEPTALISIAGSEDDHFDTSLATDWTATTLPRSIFQCALYERSHLFEFLFVVLN
ncbi:hypothetical protein AQ859_13055 [Burkholderia pseudomallei]|nr:hypothetical protein AQ760_17525 [Burkholderia pseudomallei]OMZ16416.1 hypothetical protein AQ859_13055 [Burkholderia pseudomallei]